MDHEFYKLERRFPQTHANKELALIPRVVIGENYWELSLNLESPDESLELIILDREQGTLVHGDQEFTILEITEPRTSYHLAGVANEHYLIRTPSEPDKLKRVLV